MKRAGVIGLGDMGSGLAKNLIAAGLPTTGFDLSAPMLEFAGRRLREEGHSAHLEVAAMESFRFRERFDLAHCFVSTFKYLLDEKSARAHLECVRDALKVGGVYALGFHLSDYEQTGCTRERWVGSREGIRVTCNIQSWPPDRKKRLERVRSRLIVEEDGAVRRSETEWMFRTYDAAQFRRLLRSVPGLEMVANYDFCYELAAPREFDDEQFDNVVILRRTE